MKLAYSICSCIYLLGQINRKIQNCHLISKMLWAHHAIVITIPSMRLPKSLFKLAVPYKYKQNKRIYPLHAEI